jgi:hypothetical protein
MTETSIIAVTWPQLAAASAVLLFLGAVVMVFVRAGLRKDFVSIELFAPPVERLGKIEIKVNAMPAADEIHHMARRMGAVEAGMARLSAEVAGVQHGMTRVERQLEVLTRHLLDEERTK